MMVMMMMMMMFPFSFRTFITLFYSSLDNYALGYMRPDTSKQAKCHIMSDIHFQYFTFCVKFISMHIHGMSCIPVISRHHRLKAVLAIVEK